MRFRRSICFLHLCLSVYLSLSLSLFLSLFFTFRDASATAGDPSSSFDERDTEKRDYEIPVLCPFRFLIERTPNLESRFELFVTQPETRDLDDRRRRPRVTFLNPETRIVRLDHPSRVSHRETEGRVALGANAKNRKKKRKRCAFCSLSAFARARARARDLFSTPRVACVNRWICSCQVSLYCHKSMCSVLVIVPRTRSFDHSSSLPSDLYPSSYPRLLSLA